MIREASLRLVPIEDNPSRASLAGMEFGGRLVFVLDPAERLATGSTVTGQDTSRGWAALQLGLDLLPIGLEAHALSVQSRAAAIAAEGGDASVSLAFKPNLPVGHNIVGVDVGQGMEWSHLVVGDPERASGVLVVGGDARVVRTSVPDPARYSIVNVPVSSEQAARASEVVQTSVKQGQQVGGYGLFCNDCTTYAGNVLKAAGVRTPPLSTPSLNHLSVALQSPSAVEVLHGVAATTAVGSVVARTTALEETLQKSVPAEHTGTTALEDTLQMSIPAEH